jgi:hypothetical protein
MRSIYLGSETASASYTMQVGVGVLGHVVVEHNVDSLNVHTTAEQICGNQYSL